MPDAQESFFNQEAPLAARILQAAHAHLFSYGYNALTMDDLAHELGISKKTLYVHFAGKDEIIGAVIDDLAARKCAASLGIPVIGTLGIVLRARRQGIIPAARPVVEDLLRGGMFLSRSLLDRALALVDE